MLPGSEYLGAIIKSSGGQGEALCNEPSMTSILYVEHCDRYHIAILSGRNLENL